MNLFICMVKGRHTHPSIDHVVTLHDSMTSSSEDSDGERMRLQEAVTGIPVKAKQGSSKKKR